MAWRMYALYRVPSSYLAPEGVARYCFHPVSVCMCVCVYVCLSVCVSVCFSNILAFYLSALKRDIDLKFIQDTYMVVFNSLKNIDLFESTVISQKLSHRHLLGYSIR